MKKLLLGLSLDLLLFAVLGATAAAQASTLFSDDYEGAVKWNSTSSNWAIVTAYAHGGTHSAHAPSQAGMVPMIIYGPFDLSTATAATLSFELIYTAPRYYSPPSPPPGRRVAPLPLATPPMDLCSPSPSTSLATRGDPGRRFRMT